MTTSTGSRAERPQIAFIGLGSMGLGMASKIAESGYPTTVYNRTRSKSERVAALGATVAASPADAARRADVVMLSVADQHVVTEMLFGDNGACATLRKGGYIVDMSTVPPAFARELSAKARAAGYRALDACVLGNPKQARDGELRVMVGGEEADVQAVQDVLRTIGREVTHLGENGMGATMKLVLNMLMGVQMASLAEAVVLGEQGGLPRNTILDMIASSGFSSLVMKFRCEVMKTRGFANPSFKLSLMRKDMVLALETSNELGVPMPVAASALHALTAAQQQGLGDLDVGAILASQERQSGIQSYPWPAQNRGSGSEEKKP
jgi:3-hydroxyisobutyrate dehydrogenase